MAKPTRTLRVLRPIANADLRRDFPRFFDRRGKVTRIGRLFLSAPLDVSYHGELESAIAYWLGLTDEKPGCGRVRARQIIGNAIRRTGKPRPKAYRCAEITALIDAVASARTNAAAIVDRARIEHHHRSLDPDEHVALMQDVAICRARTDYRAMLTPWLKRP